MDQLWSIEGSRWVNALPEDQRDTLRRFFGGTPDEALMRLRMRKLPFRLRKGTLEGYLGHVIEPAIRMGQDRGTYILHGKPSVGMQAFRKRLIQEALPLFQ